MSRTKPFFTQEELTKICDVFRSTMEERNMTYDQNLLEAVESYARSSKTMHENSLLRGVLEDQYRFFYKQGEAVFACVVPKSVQMFRDKYDSMENLQSDADLFKQASLDAVEWRLREGMDALKEREERLRYIFNQIANKGLKKACRIDLHLKTPFVEGKINPEPETVSV